MEIVKGLFGDGRIFLLLLVNCGVEAPCCDSALSGFIRK